ncbi:hypothetical protein IMSHALPRED_004013 [Imshaugia aleurites]|uniref:RING-type domain-containing protein n=1 Tax=Imshaugia aleurites TaxID=172621 RepID=A0A8H3I3I7_9LECA|nr:hypothetical protein IMSHALPRED_004013 [Imshaugia aleurites]
MERDQFITQLLRNNNRVQLNESKEECLICKDEYGTTSTETGKIERQIRLPCKHTVGSECIERWLQDHNTCPICRHEFFPQGDTDNDDDELDFEDDGSDGWSENDESEDEFDEDIYNDSIDDADPNVTQGAQSLENLCYLLCDALGYDRRSHPVPQVAELVAHGVWRMDAIQNASSFSNFSIAAACVYTAGHLAGRRKATKTLARIAGVRRSSVRDVYRVISDEASQFTWISWTLLGEIGVTEDRYDVLDLLPEPRRPVVRGSR